MKQAAIRLLFVLGRPTDAIVPIVTLSGRSNIEAPHGIRDKPVPEAAGASPAALGFDLILGRGKECGPRYESMGVVHAVALHLSPRTSFEAAILALRSFTSATISSEVSNLLSSSGVGILGDREELS